MAIIIFFVAQWYISLFFQTFFQHRYAAHGAFKMSKTTEKVFFVLTWLTQGSSYLSTRAYAIMHRVHHAYTDTDMDPHSPSYQDNLFKMMWRTWTIYSSIYEHKANIEPRFLKNVPDWPAFDKMASSMVSRIAFVGLYLAFYIHYATSPWFYLLLPIQILMSPVHGAVINWFAHKYGYENYKMNNTSENLFKFDFLMLGESYHNNHHKHPSSINFGVKWHEIDPVYPIILLLNKLNIIQVPKKVPVLTGNDMSVKHEEVEEAVMQ